VAHWFVKNKQITVNKKQNYSKMHAFRWRLFRCTGSVRIQLPNMKRDSYVENFDNGDGGWRANMSDQLLTMGSSAYCYGPWSVDANHAPPGAGYLHLLMYLHTTACRVRNHKLLQRNRFIQDNHSLDFSGGRLTVRARGFLDFCGPLCNYAEPLANLQNYEVPRIFLLLQSACGEDWPRANYILSGQPVNLASSWTETTLDLTPDPSRWIYLGSRHDLTHKYGERPIEDVLHCVDVNLIFVLFPLVMKPLNLELGQADIQWASRDYLTDQRYLPKGLVEFDSVRLDYA
jgi:hypothetical protein